MESKNRLYAVTSAFFIVACLLLLVYVASDVIFPLILASIFAILLRPISKFLHETLWIPNIISIGITVLIAIAVGAVVVILMSIQIGKFMNELPNIKENLNQNIGHLQNWIYDQFGVSIPEQKAFVNTTVSETEMITVSSVNSVTSSLMFMLLIPIYTFLILNYRSLLLTFLLKLVPKKEIEKLQTILIEIKSVIRNYITGLLFEVVIVATLTSIGLWSIGVEYSIFLGVLTALMNLIPYIGILAAFVISSFVALSGSTDPAIILGVLVVNVIVQFIDNNILIPKIVGSHVSINALTSMVGVIIGGSLAGIAGMFLAIPIIAILKVVFDRIPSLVPFGYLMGENKQKSMDWNKIRFTKMFSGGKKKEENKSEEDE
jgi:predicted PurR-regulated permease PerM